MAKMKTYAHFDEYLEAQSQKNQTIIRALRRFVKRAEPRLSEAVKWGNGCWIGSQGPVAYVYSDTEHVQFGFFNGSALKDPKGLLEGKGKYVRHIKVSSRSAIDETAFAALLLQAAQLRQESPESPRRSAMTVLSGQCRCGRVQISVRGDPLRVGICHCTDCRQESGSAFTFYAVWAAHQFQHAGETSAFGGRHFCPRCGSRLFSADDREAEIKLGILSDAPTPLVPTYELWIKRRERWQRPIEGAEQYEEDRK